MGKVQNVMQLYEQSLKLHNEAKEIVQEKLVKALNGIFEEFQENTGCVVTGVTVEMYQHLTHFSARTKVDKAVIASVKLYTSIDDDKKQGV